MNRIDREMIFKAMDKLIDKTNYPILKNECKQRKILSDIMISIIEDGVVDETSKHRRLFEKLTKRGPKAFEMLVDICRRNFPDAYSLLNPYTNNNQLHSTLKTRPRSVSEVVNTRNLMHHEEEDGKAIEDVHNLSPGDKGTRQLEVYEERVPRAKDLEVKLSIAEPLLPKHLTCYKMTSENRGVILIVNVINYKNATHPKRNGAETDRDNLVLLFRKLGFIVFYYEDITKVELDDLIVKLKESNYLSTECFAMYILAHGNYIKSRDMVFMYDNSILYVEDVLVAFNNQNCMKLKGRPKLFFFSICRGDRADRGVLRLSNNTESDGMINGNANVLVNMPTFSDMLICFSTVPGYAAHRDMESGSWFVESMCEVWAEHAHDTDVERLMKMVGKLAASYRMNQSDALQTVGSEQRGFFDVLYLNPGYYSVPHQQ